MYARDEQTVAPAEALTARHLFTAEEADALSKRQGCLRRALGHQAPRERRDWPARWADQRRGEQPCVNSRSSPGTETLTEALSIAERKGCQRPNDRPRCGAVSKRKEEESFLRLGQDSRDRSLAKSKIPLRI